MKRLNWTYGWSAVFLLAVTGCVAHIGAPQSRDEFVAMIKPGGLFKNVDKSTVSRPFNAVVADVKDYSNRCLSVRTTRAPNYATKESGGSTTFRPKLEETAKNAAALSVQEEYGDKHANTGAPPGGIFVLAAELRGAGANQTDVEIYYITSRGSMAEFLKKWAAGDKARCPAMS